MSSEVPASESPTPEPVKKGPPQPGAPRYQPRKPVEKRDPNPNPQAQQPPQQKPQQPQRPAPMPFVAPKPREWGDNKPNKRSLDAEIDAELNAALADAGILTALAETEQPKAGPKLPGQKKRGKVVSIHGKDVFIEVPGGRSQGVMNILQFGDKRPALGDVVEFDVERFDGANGLLILTMDGAVQDNVNWNVVQLGMIVEAKLTGMNKNKNGFQVEVNGLKGFLPLSQLDIYRVEQPEAYENQRLKVQVIELNPEERNLIVSRRAVLERERQIKAEEFWATITEGKTLKGVVKSLKPFGAFVDLGGADGLIPISEFSWQRVENIEDHIKLGQEVEVMVNRLDFENRKIGLSLRAMQSNPFTAFAEAHRPGTRLTGKVTRIAEFGAFVELAPGIEGLVHVSELSTERVRRVRDILAEGDDVTVQIVNVDVQTRRVALSLKAVTGEAEAAAEALSAAEAEADRKAALDRMANRTPSAANLRGGVGGGKPLVFGGGNS